MTRPVIVAVATCCEYEIDESEISKSAQRQNLIILRVSGGKLIVSSSERQGFRDLVEVRLVGEQKTKAAATPL
jgi:hypothetical protein